ncbi:MAG: hypothetical protein OXS29_16025 [bacterium]|nr:hypothetical protein [bacterium]MDE0288439.1 hypothetical protein [bacterium]MDE0438021.1 hypothetical protein [bacterium]
MESGSVNKLEALALIVGPTLALLFFLLEPGGMLVDSVASSDAAGKVRALASNPAMSHVVALFIPLGLLLMIYGLAGVNRAIVISRVIAEDDTAAALSRFGILGMTLGGFGWILSEGTTHILAETRIQSEQAIQAAIPVHEMGIAITLISSMVVSVGVLAFSLSLSARDPMGFHKVASLVIAAVSVVALVALIIGHSAPSEAMITLGRLCYFPWVIWFVILGVRYLKAGSAAQASTA